MSDRVPDPTPEEIAKTAAIIRKSWFDPRLRAELNLPPLVPKSERESYVAA